jgi:hypothetical protein
MVAEREMMGKELQRILDEKTTAWGITVQSVEIRDVQIPPELQDAMSREAQAERERRARIILGTAETEIAEKFGQPAACFPHGSDANSGDETAFPNLLGRRLSVVAAVAQRRVVAQHQPEIRSHFNRYPVIGV